MVLPTNVIGGLETQAYLLLQGLARYRPALLTNRAIHDYFAPLGISIHDFDDYNCADMQRRINASNFLKGARAIKRVCALERSDVVFGMGDIGLLFSVLSRDLFRMRAKVIGEIPVTLSGYFRMIGRSPLLAERLLLKYMLTRASRVVAPGNGVKQDLVENFSAREASVRVIYNGFDLDAICRLARDEIPEKKDCAWLVTACRLTEQKDFATLLQAFKIVRKQMKAKLIIVGDGHLRGWIDTMAGDLNIKEDVILTGYKHNPFPYLARADVFILSSFFEGFGNVIVEAMALGIPVIASDCPAGPAEIIHDGLDGYLVQVGDSTALAERCLLLLSNLHISEKLSLCARMRARDFCVQRMVDGYISVFEEVMAPVFR